MPESIRRDLVEPLCVAALNTPAASASGAVFLRVLHDALATGRGASDLLLPRRGLTELFPAPALTWLARTQTTVRLAHRADRVEAFDGSWRVDGEAFDAVIIAASAVEAARLAAPHDSAWSSRAAALAYEPVITVYATSPGTRLPEPMLMLHADAERLGEFVFDRGQLGGPVGLLAFVVSGTGSWLERGAAAAEQAVLAQAQAALGTLLRAPLRPLRTIVEKARDLSLHAPSRSAGDEDRPRPLCRG